MSRMYGIYVGIKKLFLLTIFTIPTVSCSNVSLQRPTLTNTTIADNVRRRRKWPPSTPHEALRSAAMLRMDGRQPPEQGDIILRDVDGEYGSQKTPMFWQCIIARTKEYLEGHTLKYALVGERIGGWCSILKARCGKE
jgi:hypothetical protein